MLAGIVGRAVPLGLVSLSLLAAPSLADELTNPANSYLDLQKHYKLGETYPITWVTSLQYITLEIRHWGSTGETVGILALAIPNSGIFDWTVGEHDNVNSKEITRNPQFKFVITDPTGKINSSTTGNGFAKGLLQSRGFIIDDTTLTSTTTSSSSTPASLAPSKTSTETSQTAAAVTDGGLTQSAKIGIGVGVGLGALLLIVVAVGMTVFVMRRRQREKSVLAAYETPVAPVPEYGDKPPEIGGDERRGELSIQNYSGPPSELPGHPDTHTGRWS